MLQRNFWRIQAHLCLDTPKEIEYYRHGGILHYVLRQLAAEGEPESAAVAAA